jgi:hypothetical protein
MTRNAPVVATLLAVVVAALLGSTSIGRAATAANAICNPFTVNGHRIQWEVIGTWTCKTAKPWVVKFDSTRVTPRAASIPLHGPAGYHCAATRESKSGFVIDGLCYKGTVAFPKSGFSW